jgi:hypothetical protein
MYFNIKSFILAFNSWIFWLKIPENEIPKRHWNPKVFGEEYCDKWPKHHYWSYYDKKGKVAENFWIIINQGMYDMRDD